MRNALKVAADMIWTLMTWTFGFLGVMYIINLIQIIFTIYRGDEVDGGFFASSVIASNIFMLVVGIIAMYFLSYYVEHGVTRKNYFRGTLLASVFVSIAIPVITILVSYLERLVLTHLLDVSYRMQDFNEIFYDVLIEIDGGIGNIIGNMITSVIMSPNIDPFSQLLLATAVFALNIFMFYLLGWLIGAAFRAGGTILGLLSVVMAFLINVLKDTLLRRALNLPFSERLAALDVMPTWGVVVSIFLLILVTIWVIRLLTKQATVDI